jgi:hypothetical protein
VTVVELTPLEDPDYVPKHPPVDGRIPDVVAKWGKPSQLRWFRRFAGDLHPLENLAAYWVTSEHHRGSCCVSCHWEFGEGIGVIQDGYCCCRDGRGRWTA